MATLVVSIGGAVLGNALGLGIASLGLSGAAVGWTIGSIIGNAVFNKPKDQYGPRLQDLRVTGTEYGQVIPRFLGSFRTSGQIIWASPKREIATTTKVGKGSKQKVTTYTYEVDLLFMIGYQIEQFNGGILRRIWSNGELIYNNNGSTVFTKAGVFSEVSVRDHTSTTPDPVYESYVGIGNAPIFPYTTVRISDLQLGQSGYIPNLSFEFYKPTKYSPSTVFDLVYREAGLYQNIVPIFDSQIDLPTINGLAITNIASCRQLLEILQACYAVEVSKSDAIYFTTRSNTPAATIPYSDLSTNESEGGEPFAINVSGNLEKVGKISLSYINPLADYSTSTETAEKTLDYFGKFGGAVAGDSSRPASAYFSPTENVQIPLIIEPVEAKKIVNRMMIDQLSSLFTAEISVPLKYAYLEPGDLINVIDKNGKQYPLRIKSRKDQMPFLTFSCVLDTAGTIVSTGITDNNYPQSTVVPILVDTNFHALDIPLLRDEDDKTGYYVGIGAKRTVAELVSGQRYEWSGAVFAESKNLLTYNNIFITGDSGVIGTATTILQDFDRSNIFDEISFVQVEVQGGQLTSATRDAILSDQSLNIAIVGNEIIRFKTATLIGSTNTSYTYRLSGLLRGQRGTEQYMVNHVSNEKFVLLDTTVRTVEDGISSIGMPLKVKGVTLDKNVSDVTGVDFTNTAVRLKPFSVANLRAVSEDGIDINVTWQRRTRYEYAYGGVIGEYVPLGETEEKYRVKIYDGATLVRTVEVTTPEYVYNSTDATADGFIAGDPVKFVVCQLSGLVGEGFPSEFETTIV